jgi:hypothetical protein
MGRFPVRVLLALAAVIVLAPFMTAYDCYCNDGWLSHSCGSPGACSGHGGIRRTTPPPPPTATPTGPTATPTLTRTPTLTSTPTQTLTFTATALRTQTPTPVPNCPDERSAVKLGTDADAGLVNLTSWATTNIETMRSWPAPSIIPLRNRVSPYETSVWVIDATLVEYKLEDDSDYHLVLIDGSGNTIIAELTSPACHSGSRFAAGVSNARAEFDAIFSVTKSFRSANLAVRVSGVGMFDFLHGQTGVAPNGIELHPVLDIAFDTQDFRIPPRPVPTRHEPRSVVH